ncbi:hypothetical protein IKG10_02025 [Candidatus Saccharibacteria bacterium]|nr:hypothetical protein [Candidatus Saccharibacteria bacterium]
MATKKSKKTQKSGAGKFFLGALLGGVAGAIAGKFLKIGTDEGEEIEEETSSGFDEEVAKKTTKTTKKAK